MDSQLWQEVMQATRALATDAAGRRGVLRVPPDVAAWLTAAMAAPQMEMATLPDDAQAALQVLKQEVAACTKCPLHQIRKQTVFSDGAATVQVAFVGEAPGADEDRQGVPFVGLAGQLLTGIIEKGMGLNRSDVYICNVLKCRPPANRDPLPEEVAQCEPYLIQQLALVKPRVICALGRHAAQTLLRTEDGIGRLRGRWHFYQGIPVRVTYHPSYLLRKPEDKRKAWLDVLEVVKVLKGELNPTPENPEG